MPLAPLIPFRVLTSLSLCRLQDVSFPRPVCFFLCPDKSFPLPCPGSEYSLNTPHLVEFFLCPENSLPLPCLGSGYSPNTSHLVEFFPYPDKSLPRHFSVRECTVIYFFWSANLSFLSVLPASQCSLAYSFFRGFHVLSRNFSS